MLTCALKAQVKKLKMESKSNFCIEKLKMESKSNFCIEKIKFQTFNILYAQFLRKSFYA